MQMSRRDVARTEGRTRELVREGHAGVGGAAHRVLRSEHVGNYKVVFVCGAAGGSGVPQRGGAGVARRGVLGGSESGARLPGVVRRRSREETGVSVTAVA